MQEWNKSYYLTRKLGKSSEKIQWEVAVASMNHLVRVTISTLYVSNKRH